MTKRTLVHLLCVIVAIMISSAIVFAGQFKQKGYLKDGGKNRIFTIEMIGKASKSAALSYAKSKPNTSGRFTAVYFYVKGSKIPADGITLARNVFNANKVLYETPGLSNWRFAYMKYMNGAESFVDCKKSPKNDMCRQ